MLSRSVLRAFLERHALAIPGAKRSLWVHGETAFQFDAARGLIRAMMAERPHVRLVLTSARPETVAFLRAAFENDLALPLPRPGALRRFLHRLQVRHLVLLEGGRSLRAPQNVSLTAVNIGSMAAVDPALLKFETARFCVFDESVASRLRDEGVGAERIAVTGCLDLDAERTFPSAAAVRRLLRVPEGQRIVAGLNIHPNEESLIRGAAAMAKLALATDPAFLPAACVAIAGGTFLSQGSAAGVAAAIAAGIPVLVGPRREFVDIPWSYLSDSAISVEAENLSEALAAAVGDSPKGIARVASSARTYAVIRDRLPRGPELPAVAQDWKAPTWRERAGASRAWRWAAAGLMRNRIESWPELRERVGKPRCILCLGNGPSAEAPGIGDVAHDCLMRVNWRWLERGILTRPQIVFAGDAGTINRVRGAIFGFWNVPLEYAMMLRHLACRGPSAMRYFTMERLPGVIRDGRWPDKPTNGALMIAAAAALEPERLVIAGLDLYLHQDGRYPGDVVGVNDYARTHSRATEVEIIRGALRQFRGEVVILSGALRQALDA